MLKTALALTDSQAWSHPSGPPRRPRRSPPGDRFGQGEQVESLRHVIGDAGNPVARIGIAAAVVVVILVLFTP